MIKNYDGRIFAQCEYGKKQGLMLALKLFVGSNGRFSWLAIPVNNQHFVDFFHDFSIRLQSEIKNLFPVDTWDQIYNALRLDELE